MGVYEVYQLCAMSASLLVGNIYLDTLGLLFEILPCFFPSTSCIVILTVTNRHGLSGQTVSSSANDFLPVILSGHSSYSSAVDSFVFCEAILGFSNATLIRSMACPGGNTSLAIRARTVQSSPPENNTPTRASEASAIGGLGTFRTLSRSDSIKWSRSCSTERDWLVNGVVVVVAIGIAALKMPILDT